MYHGTTFVDIYQFSNFNLFNKHQNLIFPFRPILRWSQEVPDELADMAQRYEEFRERNGYNDRGERGSGGRGTHLLIRDETTQFYVWSSS